MKKNATYIFFWFCLINKQSINQSNVFYIYVCVCVFNIITVQALTAETQNPSPSHYWIWTLQRFCYSRFQKKSDHLSSHWKHFHTWSALHVLQSLVDRTVLILLTFCAGFVLIINFSKCFVDHLILKEHKMFSIKNVTNWVIMNFAYICIQHWTVIGIVFLAHYL